jgi:undecaprenyl-diphosphatase
MDSFQAIIIAIIEGLTEYLPVSSTAHMIFTSSYFGIQDDEFVKMFQVSIQFGAILAVVALYWRKFFDFTNLKFYLKLAVAVAPALVLGLLFDDKIEAIMGETISIAVMLIVGGVILLFIDRFFKSSKIDKEENISFGKAIAIGLWQCLAMMPGTSRSAASIIGAMQQGLTRKMAAEFSFFLAVPTMLAVTAYSVFVKDWNVKIGEKIVEQKGYEMIVANSTNSINFVIGNIIAFVVATIAIKFFIRILQKYGFNVWGWYRIIAGIILIAYFSLR